MVRMGRWTKDAPDHFSCEITERITLSAWPMLDGSWSWECWDRESDEPEKSGKARSYEKAVEKAEAYGFKLSASFLNDPPAEAAPLTEAERLQRAIARDEAVHQILTLAVPWAREMERQGEDLSPKTERLLDAVLKYEKLQ